MNKNLFRKKSILFILFSGVLTMIQCSTKENYRNLPPYNNPNLTIEERVNDLVSRMTLSQKISQMLYDAPAIDSLDIPKYNWWNECLHGVARSGRATVFPQAIGLAATWDTDLMHRVATAISDEARAKHHEFVRRGKRNIYQGLTFWSPNINIFRDPRWGRGMETYGEDPFLTGQMAVQFIKGLQGNDDHYLKVVATAKHFAVHSGPEPDRHSFDAVVNERDLRETYLPHFRASVIDAHVFSVMCAYNRFRGEACCGSSTLLTDILRNQWGFEGYVVSDCGAVRDIFAGHKIVQTSPEAAALAVKSGTDLNCGSQYKNLQQAVEQGLLTEEDIDQAVKRLFRARFKLGMFDPANRVPYANIPYSVIDCDKHQKLALEAAQKSIVLLKNKNNLLPLKKNIGAIAVIGPNADDVEVLLGNYNGIPSHPVTPLQGIRGKVARHTKVLYSPGCKQAKNLPVLNPVPAGVLFHTEGSDRKPGLLAEFFNNREMKGTPVHTRIDEKIDFYFWDKAPFADMDDDNFSIRWSGELAPPVTGKYALGGKGLTGFRIYLDDEELVQFRSSHEATKVYKKVNLQAGKAYKIRVEFFEQAGDASMQFLWEVPGENHRQEAIRAAQQTDVTVMFMGLSPRLEGEEMKVPVPGFAGGDRLNLKLPQVQENLLKDIHKLGKPVVLVLLNGSVLAVNWADKNIPAILEAWYPGQAAGNAIADVLFGDVNPGGRLPVTFYKSVKQLPPFKNYNMTGRTYRYFNGKPLYPFGYGLSYTKFNYENLKLPSSVTAGDSVTLSVDVKNSGEMVGEEVVQLYLSHINPSAPAPIRSLRGFRRISLQPGEKKTVRFTLTPRQLSLINNNLQRIVGPGQCGISVGSGQPGFAGEKSLTTLTAKFEITGETRVLEEY
ncbi:MAG TPA: glycoside hydrolase family 3 protein [Bacteroidetes bacterium]|nr:glycoside hydrolase family 3 protein [Bacteroidota bacterium]